MVSYIALSLFSVMNIINFGKIRRLLLVILTILLFMYLHHQKSIQSSPLQMYNFFYPEKHSEVVLVIVRIQKTGGTFIERALTREGAIRFPCKRPLTSKLCTCYRNKNMLTGHLLMIVTWMAVWTPC